VTIERRTWSTEIRDPWNGKIHNMLKSVDLHVELYMQTNDEFHLEMAAALRKYVSRLKDWIHESEKNSVDPRVEL
jgi:hypothetical protein